MEHTLEKTEVNINRTAIRITQKCTLKCKLCNAYMPYYNNPQHYDLKYIQEVIENYFKIVDFVNIITITGGEPSMHPQLVKVFEMIFLYESQFKEIDMVTNNTIKLSDEFIHFIAKHKDKVKIVLDDYGKDLSPLISYNKELLEKHNIRYRIIPFHDTETCYGGWIDFSDHSVKWPTVEERNLNASKCHCNKNRFFIIGDGELHNCTRSLWRTSNNIVPRIKGEYVNILDQTISIEEKRKDIINMMSLPSVASCACCVGLSNDLPRHKPAEQL